MIYEYSGVRYIHPADKWELRIFFTESDIYREVFDTLDEAVEQYKKKVIEIIGERYAHKYGIKT